MLTARARACRPATQRRLARGRRPRFPFFLIQRLPGGQAAMHHAKRMKEAAN
jgi:hypothetical protein